MVSIKKFFEWKKLQQMEIDLSSMAVGMNSTIDMTKDLHIVMLDYDIKDFTAVKKSVQEIQTFWKLSDAEVFRTRNGHHVFFWYDQVPYGRVKLIVEFARDVDPMFKYISRYYDHKTLRASGKYKDQDIENLALIPGKRKPTEDEQILGNMKRAEHAALRGN